MFNKPCPRCGTTKIEKLFTHTHCWECNYTPEADAGLREWQEIEFKKIKNSRHHAGHLNLASALFADVHT